MPPPYWPFGNGAFEVAVVERMVLDLDRQPLAVRIERRALGHRPRLEDAVELEPEIVVQARRVMPLDDEAQLPAPAATAALPDGSAGLVEIALGAIGGETVVAHRSPPVVNVWLGRPVPSYLPMQKSRKIMSKSSSTRTVPVMRPMARSARRRSSAASAISGALRARPSEAWASTSASRWRARVSGGAPAPSSSANQPSAPVAPTGQAGRRRSWPTAAPRRPHQVRRDRSCSAPRCRAPGPSSRSPAVSVRCAVFQSRKHRAPARQDRPGGTGTGAAHAFLFDGVAQLAQARGVGQHHRPAAEIEMDLDHVACRAGVSETMAASRRARRLSSEDLPALGGPMMAMCTPSRSRSPRWSARWAPIPPRNRTIRRAPPGRGRAAGPRRENRWPPAIRERNQAPPAGRSMP